MKKIILLFAICFLFAACDKEEIKDSDTHLVTLYAYSEQGLSIINYMDAERVNYVTTIYTNSETIQTYQNDLSYDYSITLTSKGADSLFLSASYDGKTTSSAFRSSGFGETEISINLNDLN
mgnify:CR=1 FL=1|tara:strand:+ start:1502 stop:1864 length:363 start_codon:yes stop_codon:yes gene_type:complete